ncbi:hypothetical protein ACFOGJ_21965 [Marinibaculum pumilum]|uniref:Uncharacterized protein n=1 Tax=Marinibaculum pumilum TaxID=1766165 RepID=A0ABV7L6F2_9PROT
MPRIFLTLLLLALVAGGCAKTQLELANDRLAENTRLLDGSKAYTAVYRNLLQHRDHLRDDEIGTATRALLARHPEFYPAVEADFRRRAAGIGDSTALVPFAEEIDEARRYALIPEGLAAELDRQVGAYARQALETGRLKLTLTDKYWLFEGMEAYEQTLLLDNSLEVLVRDRQPSSILVSRVLKTAGKAGKGSAPWRKVRDALPRMHLSRQQLEREAARYFPEKAQAVVEARTLYLTLAGNDRLLREDVQPHLAGASPWLVLTEVPRPGGIVADLSTVQWDERPAVEKVETIRYAMSEVVALPPEWRGPAFASYAYELTSGESSLEYAVEVTLLRDGQVVESSLLRDFLRAPYAYCSAQRLENPFGGAQPVPFVANPHMETTCGSPTGPVEVQQLRADARTAIAGAILTAPAIASRL